jgi:hypothetical protein
MLEYEGVHFHFIDIDKNREGEELVKQTNRGYRSVPTIFFPDGSVFVEPGGSMLRATPTNTACAASLFPTPARGGGLRMRRPLLTPGGARRYTALPAFPAHPAPMAGIPSPVTPLLITGRTYGRRVPGV